MKNINFKSISYIQFNKIKNVLQYFTKSDIKNNCRIIIKSFNLYLFNEIVTHLPLYIIRKAYLKFLLNHQIGEKTFIHMGARFEGKIKIGNNSVIGRNCILKGEIIIKNNVSITAETYIFTHSHYVNDPHFKGSYDKVEINDFVWVGARAMILPGVTIAKGAVVGANSTVTKNVQEFEIVVGSPARKISIRSKDLKYELNYFPYFQ
jgi:maltose O-acetyltransferase